MIASLFTPVERAADGLARLCGLDPTQGAGAAAAFFTYEFVKVSILILAISWGMAFVRRSLPMERVRRWLTTPLGRLLGYPAAAGFGALTPFCSCSSVPLFIGFIETGIPVGVTFAFLITSPLVNEIVVALFLASFGWKVAALYTGSGIALGIAGGLTIQALRGEQLLSPFARSLRSPEGATAGAEDKACCCGGGGETTPASPGAPRLVVTAPLVFKPAASAGTTTVLSYHPVQATQSGCRAASRRPPGPGAFAFATGEAWGIYRQIVAYLLVALAIGAGIHGYLPEGLFADFFRSGAWWHVPAATAIGLPLYASANATVPILETLVAKGVPLGTGMALIMSAVGVSLPELVLLKRVMTVRLLTLFTLVVSTGVIVVGYIFNALPPGW
ncbi:MAG: permease [Opitutaceae bacterium]|nr:permease [Opitutaceae bacterium]